MPSPLAFTQPLRLHLYIINPICATSISAPTLCHLACFRDVKHIRCGKQVHFSRLLDDLHFGIIAYFYFFKVLLECAVN